MRVVYRGHEIDVRRDRAMGGWTSIYYSIFRQSDGYELASGFSCEDRTNVHTFVKLMRERVDAELAESTPESDSTARTTHDNPKSDKLTSCPTDSD